MNANFEAGFDYFKAHSELLLVEVHREASRRFGDDIQAILDFVEGFSRARRQHDEHRRECIEEMEASKLDAQLDADYLEDGHYSSSSALYRMRRLNERKENDK